MIKNLELDRLIVASDFAPKFLNFWPVVSQSWIKVFGITPELALVYKKEDLEQVRDLSHKLDCYGLVHLLEAAPDAPLGNQAKLARYFLAAQQANAFTMVDDIDTVHVRADYLADKFNSADHSKFIGLGAEVYKGTAHERNFPAGNFAGPGHLFAQLFNPENLGFQEFIASFNQPQRFSPRENPYNPPGKFSDEYLITSLFECRGMRDKLIILNRDQDIHREWLDRSWWAPNSEIQARKGDFEVINFLRPLFENEKRIQDALDILLPGVSVDLIIQEKTRLSFFRKLIAKWVAI